MVSFWNLTVLFTLIWIFNSHIRVNNVDISAYRPKNPYTAQYRVFLFRHRIGGKIVYHCSGTFCQITRSILGYSVYWFFLLICFAFSTKKIAPAITTRAYLSFLRIDKILAVQLTVCLSTSRLRTPWFISIRIFYLVYPGHPLFSCGSTFMIFTPM